MNKQLIKLLVLGLGFATVGNTMLAETEQNQEVDKKEEVKKDETKKEDASTYRWYKPWTWSVEGGEEAPKEAPKLEKKTAETKTVETKEAACFCTRNKTALIWTGSVVVGLGLATAAVLYFDLLGLNDQEETEEEKA